MGRKLPGTVMMIDILQAITVRKDMSLRPGEPQENLAGGCFASRAVHNLDLPIPNEIVVLHDGVHALDAVRNVDKTGPVRRVEGNAMMFLVNAEIGHVAGPVGYFGAQYRRP